jgi:hypothetical protein
MMGNMHMAYVEKEAIDANWRSYQLEVAVRNGYKQMLDGSAVTPVRLEAFTATLELPSLSVIKKEQDLNDIISYLDDQFSRWGANKEKCG